MKTKLLAFFLLPLACLAQQPLNDVNQSNAEQFPQRLKPSGSGRAMTSEWYNYGQTIFDQQGDVSYFRNFLFPDSTVLVEFTTGMGSVWKHSLGQVLDPTAPNFSFTNTQLPEYVPYTLDSIAIPYRYFRFQHGAPDTLVVQIYRNNNINAIENPGWTSGASYASVAYDYQTRLGANADFTQTLLLTDADSSESNVGLIELDLDVQLGGGDLVAVTVTYIPGNPYNVNDTIDTYMGTPPANPINAFIFYDYRDNDKLYEPGFYNNQLAVISSVRYNTNANGWNGDYIPGTAWNSGIYHGDIYFNIDFDPAGLANRSSGELRVYPNPAENFLYVELGNTPQTLQLHDAAGRLVFESMATGKYMLPTEGLTPGYYTLRVLGADGLRVSSVSIR